MDAIPRVYLQGGKDITKSQALTFQKNLLYLLQSTSFKNDERDFLFHRKTFHFQEIQIFIFTFDYVEKRFD